ncbi:GNAT family N-acetyltransferase [Actinoplanes sp. NPDC051494]|uniref:GNAT family N-acetyltransferase n=1 Tax=Actinoplanes sp. NPDC051494 TaxID=3363907 RepID=UPI003787CA40
MTRADFEQHRAQLIMATAEAMAEAEGFTVREAEARATQGIADLLPQGPATPGQVLRRAVVGGGAEVGWIWVSLPGTLMPGMAWISSLEVDPAFRRRGWAARILELTERDLAGRGITTVGLNVFGSNVTAQRLYERQGYAITNQQWARELVDIPSPDGITLVPMRDYDERMAALVEDYAGDLREEEGRPAAEARAAAERKIAALLPDGAATGGAILRTVVAEGVEAGWVWAGPPPRHHPGTGWLHNIEIDAKWRSRGHGSRVIAAVQRELRGRGLRTIGLNVHGYNVRARALYARLGFELTAQQMIKKIDVR